jgi:hypothetical protein
VTALAVVLAPVVTALLVDVWRRERAWRSAPRARDHR